MKVPISDLVFGRGTGVTMKEAKKYYLMGMTPAFRRGVRVKFIKR